MEALEFEVDGVAYQAKPIDGFVALDISMLLSPVMVAGSAEIIASLKEANEERKAKAEAATSKEIFDMIMSIKPKIPIEEFLRSFGPAAQYLARMRPEDRRFILTEVLKGVSKKEGDRYVSIWSPGAGRPISDDLFYNLALMLRIAWPVINKALGSFFSISL